MVVMSSVYVLLLLAISCFSQYHGAAGSSTDKYTLNYTKSHLRVNEAALCLLNLQNETVTINITYGNCYRCRGRLLVNSSRSIQNCTSIGTNHGFTLFVRDANGRVKGGSCASQQLPSTIEPKGVVNVMVSGNGTCRYESEPGTWPYMPLIGLVCILFAVALAWNLGQVVVVRMTRSGYSIPFQSVRSSAGIQHSATRNRDNSENENIQSGGASGETQRLVTMPSSTAQRPRLRSLDTFRGLSLVIMIFVNYGGGGYWFFQHSKWNGLTVADLVFPWFVFILGTSAAISLNSLDRRGVSRWRMLLKVVRRFVILFALGLFLNGTNVLRTYRIPGVLQRLALSYLGISLLHLAFASKRDRNTDKVFAPVREVINHWIEWVVAVILIMIWLLITFLLPFDHCPPGYLYPGGELGDYGNYMNASSNCTGGAAGYIDRQIFGIKHIYPTPECVHLYMTGPFDPEGALGTLTSIFLAFLGQNAGRILLVHPDDKRRLIRWVLWGIFWGALGTALCEGKQNGGVIPINKSLWSLSFVCVMAGTGYILLALLYYIIDVKKLWMGGPFVFPGMNSILVYVGHEMVHRYFPFSWDAPQEQLDILAQSFVGTCLWVIIAYYLYVIDFFVKV
ncbi:heparan-alpha-glucosaminide N-acetyltransferase-like [Corticium candelabrum]|uniref:heparan-alpha-glucosaminide N-acetyltransferase-like n=1 Tax=Corticium candelabrum TaxID=121492 RepID=UPI002E26AB84|nr:heparan-alpha-glucosaminide N-acetyltransferase-like [Corticium candelabrum]